MTEDSREAKLTPEQLAAQMFQLAARKPEPERNSISGTRRGKAMPKITRQNMTPLASQILEHWETYRPRMAAEFKEQGRLVLECQLAADKTKEMLYNLEDQGMSRDQAWELVREEYAFLPEEEGVFPEPEPSEGYKIYLETQQEFRQIMEEHYQEKHKS